MYSRLFHIRTFYAMFLQIQCRIHYELTFSNVGYILLEDFCAYASCHLQWTHQVVINKYFRLSIHHKQHDYYNQ